MTQTVSGAALVDFDGAEHGVESVAAAFGSRRGLKLAVFCHVI